MKTSGRIIPALAKADVAYARVADVQIAQHGCGKKRYGANWNGCVNFMDQNGSIRWCIYQIDDGLYAWEQDDAWATICRCTRDNIFLEELNRSLMFFFEIQSQSGRAITSRISGSSIPRWIRKFSTVRMPCDADSMLQLAVKWKREAHSSRCLGRRGGGMFPEGYSMRQRPHA